MAETDMKTISELDFYPDAFDSTSILPVVVNPNNSNITKKIPFPALRARIIGYELFGVLTAGSTSVTITSIPTNEYNEQVAYSIGAIVTHTVDQVAKNYVCVTACSAANWETNNPYFIEYTPIGTDSTIKVYTNPALLYTGISVANNAVTITFPEQLSDVLVKVRVS